jgi:AbrB family looped-hinge helix DNA binding protein
MEQVRAKIGQGGRIVIPAAQRKALRLKVGDEVVLRVEDEELRIMSLDQAVRRAQRAVRKYVPKGVRLSDELIAERRAEAARE